MKKLLVLLFVLFTCSAFAGGLPGSLTGVGGVGGDKLPLTGGTLTGKLKVPNGSSSAPSISGATDLDGFYFSPTLLGFSVNGSGRMTLSNTLLTVHVGMANATTGRWSMPNVISTNLIPSYAWVGDTTSGLGHNAAGQPSMIGSGTEVQRWTNTGTTNFKAVSHIVAGGGYTTYQGNTAYSATGEDSVTLPLDAAATSIAFDAETSGYIRAEIVGTNSTDTACIHVTLTAAYEDFGDTLAFVGSPASLTDQLNAATWSASLSASGDSLSVIATGAVGTLWQVKKLEIGGL